MIILGNPKPGWLYYKEQVVQYAAGAGTGYQMNFMVNYGSGTDTATDIYLNGKCNTDFSDLRFLDSDGFDLNYYVNGQVNGDYADIWVKINADISTSNTTIFLYYGNDTAISESDGIAVFQLFDDFESGVLTGWTSGSDEPWIITTYAYHGTYCATNTDIDDDGISSIQQSKVLDVASRLEFEWRVSSEGTYDYLAFYIDSAEQDRISGAGLWTSKSYDISAGTKEFKWSYVKDSSESAGEDSGYIDKVKVRKYVSPEPTFSIWGAQETSLLEATFYTELSTSLGLTFESPKIELIVELNSSVYAGIIVVVPEINFYQDLSSACIVGLAVSEIPFTKDLYSVLNIIFTSGEVFFDFESIGSVFMGAYIVQPPSEFLKTLSSHVSLGLYAGPMIFTVDNTVDGLDVALKTDEILFSLSGPISQKTVVFTTTFAVVYYLFTLTGAADSTTDIEIPISSFQCRMRSGDPTYLSVVIPGSEYATEITARANGTLQIEMAYKQDGAYLQREVIVQADLETVAIDEGADNQSITLTGHKTETFTAKTTLLENSVYRSVKSGKIRHRIAKPNIYLRPGDTVTVESDTFTADVISYAISVDSQTMEVAEA